MGQNPRHRMYVTVLSTAYVLTTRVPHPVTLAGELRSPRVWVADVGTDAAAATLVSALLWLIALWVACGLAAITISLLPGRLGRWGRTAAERVTPAALRRVVITAAGTSILLSPVTAMAAPASGAPPAPSGASSVLPAIGWPTDPDPATATDPATTAARPATATDPVTVSGADSRPDTRAGTQSLRTGDRVTVRPGDSLWSMAADRLGTRPPAARIQAEWPRWYEVNRRVIGADPNLLRPGTSLLIPQPAPTEPTP